MNRGFERHRFMEIMPKKRVEKFLFFKIFCIFAQSKTKVFDCKNGNPNLMITAILLI